MPHFIIEHGNALQGPGDADAALQSALDCGSSCGFITPADIKVRLLPYTRFLSGDGRSSFIHITVRLLAGRSPDQKESLALSLREAFAARFPKVQSISIEVRDMDPVSYKKRLFP
jgi:5-carboxymethyl-2-hydroxymuconate isomerase